MEKFEKYLNSRGAIDSNYVNAVNNIINGPNNLFEKSLILRILMVTDQQIIEDLEFSGLRDVIHVWFESAVEAKDCYFLILLIDAIDKLSFQNFADQIKKVCNLNNRELTIRARNVLFKWKAEADNNEKKNAYTYINLDKPSTAKRFNNSCRRSDVDDGNDQNTLTKINDVSIEVPKIDIKNILSKNATPVKEMKTKEKIIKNANTKNNQSAGLMQDSKESLNIPNNSKKRISWAENDEVIIIDEDSNDSLGDLQPPRQNVEKVATPILETNAATDFDEKVTKKPQIMSIEQRKLAISKILLGIIVAGNKGADLGDLTPTNVYDLLKAEQGELNKHMIVLEPPK